MKTILLITFLIITRGIISAQERLVLLDSLFSTMHDRTQFNGNVLIADKGEIIYRNSFGYADLEKRTIIDENTLFNIGSITKAFTALAIQQLEEQGKLNISDSVVKYLPEFPYSNVTIHHLLIHASGLPDISKFWKSEDPNKIAYNKDVLGVLYTMKPDLMFNPGEESEYSNLGYMVLAEIVQAVSGLGFKEYLIENIFEPANMRRTNIYNAEEILGIENVARGLVLYPITGNYEEAIKLPEFSMNYVMSGFKGDGNAYSTILDLFSFYQALSNGILISMESLNRAFGKHIPAKMQGTPDYGNSYGYGWTIINAPVKIVHRGGELAGYVSNIIWNITDGRLTIYLINDYLAYTSYHQNIPMAVTLIMTRNELQIPKLIASIELTKTAINSSVEEFEEIISTIKKNPDIYRIDMQGLKFLVMKLQQIGEHVKSDLVLSAFGPE